MFQLRTVTLHMRISTEHRLLDVSYFYKLQIFSLVYKLSYHNMIRLACNSP